MYICKDILHIIHMPDVEKLQISPHLSCGEILNYSTCGEISDFSTFVMHINLKFLYMTNFSPHIYLVILVTNIRYEWLQCYCCSWIVAVTKFSESFCQKFWRVFRYKFENLKGHLTECVCVCASPLTTTNCLFSLNPKKMRIFCRGNLKIGDLQKLRGILLQSPKGSQPLPPWFSVKYTPVNLVVLSSYRELWEKSIQTKNHFPFFNRQRRWMTNSMFKCNSIFKIPLC